MAQQDQSLQLQEAGSTPGLTQWGEGSSIVSAVV